MARRKKPPLSTVVAFMSDDAQSQFDTEPQSLATVSVAEILPDIGQPRRLLPDDIAQAVSTGATAQRDALNEWLARAEAEQAAVALRRSIRELKRLADSIARHGLISPISVREPHPNEIVPPDINYLIVTGERRFWAHVYLVSQGLHINEGDMVADPTQIKVTIASPGVTIRAHQLIENLLREDINATERARGLWALRYELSGVDDQPASTGEQAADEEAVAEVNHGSPSAELVPWARVEEALGISKRYRIFMTSVLNLSPEALAIADRHNLAERTIRPIVQKLKGRPDLQVEVLQQLVTWQAETEEEEGSGRAIVASVKELVDHLLAEDRLESKTTSPGRTTRSVSSAPVVRLQNQVRLTLDFLNRLKAKDRAGLTKALSQNEYTELMIDLRYLRQQIDQILETASKLKPADEHMYPPVPEESSHND
ncbi:MAG TPA: ParB N-terminal domain-containing protein [Anaerolineae bacterium]